MILGPRHRKESRRSSVVLLVWTLPNPAVSGRGCLLTLPLLGHVRSHLSGPQIHLRETGLRVSLCSAISIFLSLSRTKAEDGGKGWLFVRELAGSTLGTSPPTHPANEVAEPSRPWTTAPSMPWGPLGPSLAWCEETSESFTEKLPAGPAACVPLLVPGAFGVATGITLLTPWLGSILRRSVSWDVGPQSLFSARARAAGSLAAAEEQVIRRTGPGPPWGSVLRASEGARLWILHQGADPGPLGPSPFFLPQTQTSARLPLASPVPPSGVSQWDFSLRVPLHPLYPASSDWPRPGPLRPHPYASALPCPRRTFSLCQGRALIFSLVSPGGSGVGSDLAFQILVALFRIPWSRVSSAGEWEQGKGKGSGKDVCGSECFLDPEDGWTLVSTMLFNEELTSLSPELNQVEGTVLQAEKQITWLFQGFILIPLKMGVKPCRSATYLWPWINHIITSLDF